MTTPRDASVASAAASGDQVATLKAMRANLAGRLDDPDARDAAAIARQLLSVLDAIAELEPEGAADLVDELKSRRAARLPASPSGVGASRRGRKSGA